jgi:hypothetical protein
MKYIQNYQELASAYDDDVDIIDEFYITHNDSFFHFMKECTFAEI